MHPYRVAEIIHTVIPHMIQQLFLTYRTPSVKHQIFKNSDFFSCESKLLSGSGGDARSGIKCDLAAGEDYIILCELPQGKTAYAGLKLLQMKRLGKIIAGSGIKPRHLVGNLASRRQNQYRCILILLPQAPKHRHTVCTRQVKIQKHKIIALYTKKSESFVSVMAEIHTVGKTPQAADNSFAERAFVFNDQNMHKKSLLALCFHNIECLYYNTGR